MKIDWQRKLSSRKFWAMVGGVIAPSLLLFNVDLVTIEKVIAVVSAEGALIAYIFAEAKVDASRSQ